MLSSSTASYSGVKVSSTQWGNAAAFPGKVGEHLSETWWISFIPWTPCFWSRGGKAAGTPLLCFYHQTLHSLTACSEIQRLLSIYLWLDFKLPGLSILHCGVNSIHRAASARERERERVKCFPLSPLQKTLTITKLPPCLDALMREPGPFIAASRSAEPVFFTGGVLIATIATRPMSCWISMWKVRCICSEDGVPGDGGLHMVHICLPTDYRPLHLSVWLPPPPPPAFFFISIVTGTAATGESRSTGN